jgi:hypothetical protein
MRKNILVVGCSFSHHTINEYGKKDNGWPDWIKEELSDKLYVCNMSLPGASNELIKRIVTKKTLEEKWDYVIIQWSTIDRWDYPTCLDEHPIFVRYWPNGTNLGGKNEQFYKHYYSTYGAVIDTLENIYHNQTYLIDANIPYKMITIGNLMQMDVAIHNLVDLQKRQDNRGGDYSTLKTKNILEQLEDFEDSFYEANIIKELLEKIDFSNFLFTDNTNIGGFGGGIIEWLTNNDESMAEYGYHPTLRQSTRFFDEFLWPKIKDEVEKNYNKINK